MTIIIHYKDGKVVDVENLPEDVEICLVEDQN